MSTITYSPAPTKTLSPSEMLTKAKEWALKVPQQVPADQPLERRWYYRLHSEDGYEVWLLGWNSDQSTEFHNHGGSAGTFVVVAGELCEKRASCGRAIKQRNLKAGGHSAFGPEAIHDVCNADNGPSLSIHVYSPPLRSMTYFDVVDGQPIERNTELVDGPEPDGDERFSL